MAAAFDGLQPDGDRCVEDGDDADNHPCDREDGGEDQALGEVSDLDRAVAFYGLAQAMSTVVLDFHCRTTGEGRIGMQRSSAPQEMEPGTTPRSTKLMALALKLIGPARFAPGLVVAALLGTSISEVVKPTE